MVHIKIDVAIAAMSCGSSVRIRGAIMDAEAKPRVMGMMQTIARCGSDGRNCRLRRTRHDRSQRRPTGRLDHLGSRVRADQSLSRALRVRLLNEYDCSARTVRLVEIVEYANSLGNGDALRSYPGADTEARPVTPGSVSTKSCVMSAQLEQRIRRRAFEAEEEPMSKMYDEGRYLARSSGGHPP